MNAYDQGRTVEAEALALLAPYLRETCEGLVLLDKGPLASALQQSYGDLIVQSKGRALSCELKAERKWTGNFFLETWSNKNLNDKNSHIKYGSNPGWMYKLKCDYLLYYFLDIDALYMMDMFKLQKWFFENDRFTQFEEVKQSKYSQANDTYGRLVKIEDVQRAIKCPVRPLKQPQISPELLRSSDVRVDNHV